MHESGNGVTVKNLTSSWETVSKILCYQYNQCIFIKLQDLPAVRSTNDQDGININVIFFIFPLGTRKKMARMF